MVLNKLKTTWEECLSFVHYYGFCSKKYISKDFKRFEILSLVNSKYFKISQGTFMGTFLIIIYTMGEQWMKNGLHRWISSKMILTMMLKMMLLMMSTMTLNMMLTIMLWCHGWHHLFFNKFHEDQPWVCLGIINGFFSSFR